MPKRVVVGLASEIPLGEGRNFVVEDQLVAVFRPRTGGVYATAAHCPHRQGPLADGLVGAHHVICPLHEWQFDLRTGETLNGTCAIRTYPISEEADGRLVVEI
jgi:nitrite reductase (NADH) small subunit